METELKLSVASDDIAAFQENALLKMHATEKPCSRQLDSTYFDTPNLYFRSRGVSLRVRHIEGEGWVQTIKGDANPTAGLHLRDEWETPLRSPLPELAALRRLVKQDPHWRKILSPRALSRQLVPLFTTHIQRTTWMLSLPGGDSVELALDQGNVVHDKSQTAISEIELELKSGNAAHLFDFALQLHDSLPLQIDNISKADRGFALCVPQPPKIVKASRSELSASMTVENGFQTIVMNCLVHIEGNAQGVAQGHDPESVHQMRIGLRRLHSALKQFKKIFPFPDALQADFDWLSDALSAARDWEVLTVMTLPAVIGKFPDRADLATLQSAAFDIAADKRAAAAKAVSSPRYTHLMLAFAGWVRGARWRESDAQPTLDEWSESIKKFAGRTIKNRRRSLLKRGKNLEKLNMAQRHKVRIAAKRVRYATEFFAPLYSKGKVEAFVGGLSNLQDMLGKMNDLRVADGLLQQAGTARPELTAASEFARGYLAAQLEQDLPKLNALWKKFRNTATALK